MGMMSSEMFNTSFLVSGKVLEINGSAIYMCVFPFFLLVSKYSSATKLSISPTAYSNRQ